MYPCSDSCQRGWRLLYILTAFHRCSEVLKPFLLKYLQQASLSAGPQYQGKNAHTHINLLYRLAKPPACNVSLNRHRQSMRAEPEEDIPVWWPHCPTQQHGAEGHDGQSFFQLIGQGGRGILILYLNRGPLTFLFRPRTPLSSLYTT